MHQSPAVRPFFLGARRDLSRIGTGKRVAGATGLEPATSGVTGRRSNQLSYTPGIGPGLGPRAAVMYSTPWRVSSGPAPGFTARNLGIDLRRATPGCADTGPGGVRLRRRPLGRFRPPTSNAPAESDSRWCRPWAAHRSDTNNRPPGVAGIGILPRLGLGARASSRPIRPTRKAVSTSVLRGAIQRVKIGTGNSSRVMAASAGPMTELVPATAIHKVWIVLSGRDILQ